MKTWNFLMELNILPIYQSILPDFFLKSQLISLNMILQMQLTIHVYFIKISCVDYNFG